MRFKIYRFIFLFSVFAKVQILQAQTFIFAQLSGTPSLNTSGWNLTGNAYVGDTGGDTDGNSNELILTNASGNQSGGVFYGTAINPLICSKWTVEFDYRIWGGSAADGLAFCFLDVPPTGFVSGAGVGIPASANGLKVVLDTWNNCGGSNPELQIYSGTGYNECANGIVKLNNSGGSLNFVRSNSYQPVKITYVNGVVTLFINNQQYLTANFPINFTGYMGFTASTGGSSDQHSVRNVVIYTDQAASNAGGDISLCSNEIGQIGVTTNPNFIYSWSPAAGLSNTTISNPTVGLTNNSNSPITQVYTVTTSLASNPGVCPTTDQVSVTVYPNYSTNVSTSICNGDSILFNSNYIKNQGSYSALLSTINGCDSTINLSLNVLETQQIIIDSSICQGASVVIGSQSFSTNGSHLVTLQNVFGCDSTIILNLTVYPLPILNSNSESICYGDTAVLQPSGANSYTWVPSLGFWNSNNEYSVSTNTSVSLNLIGVDLNGCSNSIQVPITVLNLPNVQISSNNLTYCLGDQITLSASGATNYQWPEFIPSVASQQNFQAIQSATYHLIGIDGNGCQNEDSISITVNPIPQLSATPDQEICLGEFAQISVSGAVSYVWSPEGSGSVNSFNPTQTTTYTIIGINSFNCTSQINATITVHPNPIANLDASPLVTTTDSPFVTFFNNTIGSVNDVIYFGDGSAVDFFQGKIDHTYPYSQGNYLVTLVTENQFGCIDSVQKTIQIKSYQFFYVPNTFTPNGDEVNQLFYPIISNGYDLTKFSMEIYNRWGELIFRTENIEQGWDGFYRGVLCPEGVYTWKINLKESKNDYYREVTGHVNLFK